MLGCVWLGSILSSSSETGSYCCVFLLCRLKMFRIDIVSGIRRNVDLTFDEEGLERRDPRKGSLWSFRGPPPRPDDVPRSTDHLTCHGCFKDGSPIMFVQAINHAGKIVVLALHDLVKGWQNTRTSRVRLISCCKKDGSHVFVVTQVT